MPDWLTVSDEVRFAVAAGRPVVALESTLIAHGLPWPVNLETARELSLFQIHFYGFLQEVFLREMK